MTSPTNNTERSVAEVVEPFLPCRKCGSTQPPLIDQMAHAGNRWTRECLDCCYSTETLDTQELADAAWNHRTEAEARVGEVSDAPDDKLVATLECCVRNEWGTCTIGLADIPRVIAALKPTEPSEAKVERVAAALYDHWRENDVFEECCDWSRLPGKHEWRERARAALAAAEEQG